MSKISVQRKNPISYTESTMYYRVQHRCWLCQVGPECLFTQLYTRTRAAAVPGGMASKGGGKAGSFRVNEEEGLLNRYGVRCKLSSTYLLPT